MSSPSNLLLPPSEPWRCTACGHLMYNLDENGYPAPGAPMPKFWSLEHNKICHVCHAMALSVNSSAHFRAAHDDWRNEELRNKDLKERHTGRRDYLTGF